VGWGLVVKGPGDSVEGARSDDLRHRGARGAVGVGGRLNRAMLTGFSTELRWSPGR
jgi:hypothetical protein